MKIMTRFLAIGLLLFVAACASHPTNPRSSSRGNVSGTLSSNGEPAPAYKVGEPYEVSGNWYYPHEDYSYDETGIASFYGEGFHGGTTANGEVFNKNELTAAHKTLPLPTLARVTNLDNGRSIVVRINDRGPFSGSRIIDVSQRAAQLLGFEQQGTAKVRVQVLADESKAIADAMRRYGTGTPTQLASAEPSPAAQTETTPPPGVASASVAAVTSETLEPVRTTPEVHQQLLETKPVAEVLQVPVTGSHQIYVQGGAFTVLDNATKMQQNLSKLGQAKIVEAIVNGRKFYRVRVGPVPDVTHADALLERVKASGVAAPRTVVE
jgi:rare lipoprotein A